MKLSMWMIANKLEGFELELSIEPHAPAVLKSARRAYATDCIYVSQRGEDAVARGTGGEIVIHNINASLALVILQSIFDFYDDWDEELHAIVASAEPDFQRAVDISAGVFQNPIVLSDANYRVLGMSEQYGIDDVDEEWSILMRDGYHSVAAVRALNVSNYDFALQHAQIVRSGNTPHVQVDCITVPIFSGDAYYGRFTLIQLHPKSPRGYIQLSEHFAAVMTSAISRADGDLKHDDRRSWLFALLENNPIPDNELALQLRYYDWDIRDEFYVCTIQLRNENDPQPGGIGVQTLKVLQRRVRCAGALYRNRIVLVLASRETTPNELTEHLEQIIEVYDVIYSISLPFTGVKNLPTYYKQTEIAAHLAAATGVSTVRCDYYDYAVDDMLLAPLTDKSAHSCHPDIRMLRTYDAANNTEYLQTLRTFLRHERSIVNTAQELFIHRNTLVYRIKKINELIGCNLDDAYTRIYLTHSIRIYELLDTLGLT